MNFVLFYHSLVSDWNHGNAHFLRGIVTELMECGHSVRVYEPAAGWSLRNLRERYGNEPVNAFHAAYPRLRSSFYEVDALDLDEVLDRADIVIVHEWNDPELVVRIGRHRARARSYRLLFHDTHHRAVSAPDELRAFDLSDYDGVLVFGEVLRCIYEKRGWAARTWTWHEAADTRVFRPIMGVPKSLDLVWVGNWGDGERNAEIMEFLVDPVREAGLRARVYGVRYPEDALRTLCGAHIDYAGWIANFEVPAAFAEARATVHVPRRFYRHELPGIPTIRVFEALACGIPLVSAPWEDEEGLFTPGRDFLVARDGHEMGRHLHRLRSDPVFARELAAHGYRTLVRRHTCAHRVDELLAIGRQLGCAPRPPMPLLPMKGSAAA